MAHWRLLWIELTNRTISTNKWKCVFNWSNVQVKQKDFSMLLFTAHTVYCVLTCNDFKYQSFNWIRWFIFRLLPSQYVAWTRCWIDGRSEKLLTVNTCSWSVAMSINSFRETWPIPIAKTFTPVLFKCSAAWCVHKWLEDCPSVNTYTIFGAFCRSPCWGVKE